MTTKCVVCGKRLKDDQGDTLYYTPKGERIALCGRPKCERVYNLELPEKKVT